MRVDKRAFTKLFEHIESTIERQSEGLSYWSRLQAYSKEAYHVTQMFANEVLGDDLKNSLVPQSKKAIRFCVVEGMDEFTVPTMDKYVTKVSRPSQEIFKVVSFCPLDA